MASMSCVSAPNAQTRRLVRSLDRSLALSIQAGTAYGRWLDDLAGGGAAACQNPTANEHWRAAQVINGRTQTAKQQFVRSYNPLARRFDRRTWTSLDI